MLLQVACIRRLCSEKVLHRLITLYYRRRYRQLRHAEEYISVSTRSRSVHKRAKLTHTSSKHTRKVARLLWNYKGTLLRRRSTSVKTRGKCFDSKGAARGRSTAEMVTLQGLPTHFFQSKPNSCFEVRFEYAFQKHRTLLANLTENCVLAA